MVTPILHAGDMASDKPVRWAPGVQTQPPRKTALQNACVLLTGATGYRQASAACLLIRSLNLVSCA